MRVDNELVWMAYLDGKSAEEGREISNLSGGSLQGSQLRLGDGRVVLEAARVIVKELGAVECPACGAVCAHTGICEDVDGRHAFFGGLSC